MLFEQLLKWIFDNLSEFFILIFTASSLTVILYDRFRKMTRFRVQEFSVSSSDDFDFVILNASDNEAPRCHADVSVYRKDGTEERVLPTFYWEVPEFGGKFVYWHICNMKPKAHYVLQSKVPEATSEKYKKGHKNAELPSNHGFHYMRLRIWKGGEINGIFFMFWYYIPEDYVKGSKIPHGQLGRLRTNFPKKLWLKLMKRKIDKLSKDFPTVTALRKRGEG